MTCRVSKKNTNCGNELPLNGPVQEPFVFCLPLGYVLKHTGDVLKVEGNPSVPDGVYDEIVIQNGCIVEARKAPAPSLTPAPCTPIPGDCAEGSDGVNIDPSSNNILVKTALGALLARVFTQSSSSVSVAGNGTAQEPFIFTATQQEASRTYIVSTTPDVLPVSGEGVASNPYTISHTAGRAGSISGLIFDSYGHLIGTDSSGQGEGVLAVVQGPGITVENQAGVATISLPVLHSGEATYNVGGFALLIDLYGRVKGINQTINLPAGLYDAFTTAFTLDANGSISGVTPVVRFSETNFSQMYSPGRVETTMWFTPRLQGSLRIKYTGDLGLKTAFGVAAGSYGLQSLTINPPTVELDLVSISYKAFISNERVSGLEILITPDPNIFTLDEPHQIVIRQHNDNAFTDTAILDVTICQS